MSIRGRQSVVFATLAASVLLLVAASAQDQGQVREFTVVGDHYAFSPGTLTVNRNDLVKITFTAQDMPHSFSIDGPYRISKRAGAGQSVTFEFRADQPGNHAIYCALSTDPKCREMKGTLTVR
jgi:heme/copper-type cytochrome/quinol oxidase subunit 2